MLYMHAIPLPNTVCVALAALLVLMACDVITITNIPTVSPSTSASAASPIINPLIASPITNHPARGGRRSAQLKTKAGWWRSIMAHAPAAEDYLSIAQLTGKLSQTRQSKQSLADLPPASKPFETLEDTSQEPDQTYTFKMLQPNSMGPEDMQWCPGVEPADLKPVNEKLKFLFILGAQKAGTTWLHGALEKHPIFIEAEDAYRGGWSKEVRFFNSLPVGTSQEYLQLFPTKMRQWASRGVPTVFLDSTPNSLFSPTVAPRVKQAIPHAKFVIVLRDPVARTVSSHNMMLRNPTRCWGDTCYDATKPLLETFREHRDQTFEWPENLSGCNFNTTVEDIGQRKTWGDCWRCDHFVYACDLLTDSQQRALGSCQENTIPHVPTLPLTHYGLYAAQLAWWISFFPPESFLILTREEIQDPDRVVPALNKVLEHVGYSNTTKKFTKELIGEVDGFKGKYAGDMSAEDEEALKEMADFFENPNKDLQNLMDTYFPQVGFQGFKPEYII